MAKNFSAISRARKRRISRTVGQRQTTVNNASPVAETWGSEADVSAPANALFRYAVPEDDMAQVVPFLANKGSQFITGSSLTPDRGLLVTARRRRSTS
jgi:3-oxoacyl-[acyl-carrier protein] reductase